MLAANPHIDDATARLILAGRDGFARGLVVANPTCPLTDALAAIEGPTDAWVLYGVARRSDMPPARRQQYLDRAATATGDGQFHPLVESRSTTWATTTANREWTTGADMRCHPVAVARAAREAVMTPAQLMTMARDPSASVRIVATEHHHRRALRELALDADEHVATSARERLALDRSAIDAYERRHRDLASPRRRGRRLVILSGFVAVALAGVWFLLEDYSSNVAAKTWAANSAVLEELDDDTLLSSPRDVVLDGAAEYIVLAVVRSDESLSWEGSDVIVDRRGDGSIGVVVVAARARTARVLVQGEWSTFSDETREFEVGPDPFVVAFGNGEAAIAIPGRD